MKYLKQLAAGALISAALASSVFASTLVINSDQSDPAPKKAWNDLIARFEKANPDIKIKYNLYDHEAYKTAVRNWLVTAPPDVLFWYSGNRMDTFVKRGLIDNISDLWKSPQMRADFKTAMHAITMNGKQYGMPYSYYQWGIYYRKDIFKKYNLQVPKTWKELLKDCAALKSHGITPFAIGTKYLWPAAGWFDYIDLRVNGYAFHMKLMHGKIPYTDPRVKKVFSYWKQLVKPGYFLANHPSYSWQEAQPFLYNGKAAMYLIGNFITPNFTGKIKSEMGFFPFPQINPKIPDAEEAPIEALVIPAKAKNKADARKFLKFVAKASSQQYINKLLEQIPTNNKAAVKNDPFLKEGVKMLNNATATSQFYDRDTPPAMAKEGMKGFQEFMVHPDRINQILQHLERVRQRVFRK
ncbi:ABC transporter substrate-binding protein [Celerinatantimonas diazotrophica]|uniref:Carbohydrate ABC transporter substrate-binding protein (CUT1 family) n=1 Tax=Celerinatantimonas diazotrophica TaxID=412034 RepID=A0A4R1J7K1_9GAMM|nr:extracellular solute-binding protein [Celerinatantimonas diazotrophica]TCK46321.1 carbohydrate ABC transporter substrate-binding protein (CUT1 family) [Celerinatantimonas diazotrophica]CAG9295305.1 hypothetical protein CEDIAZO_00417 [Celerinatantimonas diazotrophica]